MNSETAITMLSILRKEMERKRTREQAIKELAGFVNAVATDSYDTLYGDIIKHSCICAAIDMSVATINSLPSEKDKEVK